MLSLRFMEDEKAIDGDTFVGVIEHKAHIMRALRLSVRRRWPDSCFHMGDFADYPLSGEQDGHDMARPYDWINVDTESSPKTDSFDWLSKIRIAEEGEVNLWFTDYRNNRLTAENLIHTFLGTKDGRRVFRDVQERLDLGPLELEEYKPEILATLCAIITAMSHYDFILTPPMVYRDRVNNMYVYRLCRVEGNSGYPSLADLYEESDWYYNQPQQENGERREGRLSEDMHIHAMCIELAFKEKDGIPISIGEKAYLTNRMRREMKASMESKGSSPDFVKRGWKAHISAQLAACAWDWDEELVARSHSLVDRVDR